MKSIRYILFAPIAAVILGGLVVMREISIPIPSVSFLAASANRYERAQAATVLLTHEGREGSGVVFKRRTIDKRQQRLFIFTAGHVARDVQNFSAKRVLHHEGIRVGEIVFTAEVIARFPGVDAALLWLHAPDSAFANTEWTDATPVVGTPVFHVGNFYGVSFDGSVSRGIISQIGVHPVDIPAWPWLGTLDQGDFRVTPGSSGGPVFNDAGSVIGLVVGGPNQGASGVSCYLPTRVIAQSAAELHLSWAMTGTSCPSDVTLRLMAANVAAADRIAAVLAAILPVPPQSPPTKVRKR